MELTSEERQAVEHGGVVKYVIPGSPVQCVVLREDLLDHLRTRFDYSTCDADDLPALTAEVLPDEDWTVPEGQPTVNILSSGVGSVIARLLRVERYGGDRITT
jgi:hypothetical protein